MSHKTTKKYVPRIIIETPQSYTFQHFIQNEISTFSSQKKKKLEKHGDFFLGRGFGGIFAIWSISSHVGVQIGLELVRLIALIGLKKFWTNVTSPKSLKKFHARHFDDPSSENGNFWCFKGFH